jgi:hypothetical protein
MQQIDISAPIQPRLVARECGGWLAISPHGSALRIGVTAATESEAREAYHQSLAQWLATLRADNVP